MLPRLPVALTTPASENSGLVPPFAQIQGPGKPPSPVSQSQAETRAMRHSFFLHTHNIITFAGSLVSPLSDPVFRLITHCTEVIADNNHVM